MVYVGVVLLLVTAMFVSSGKKKGTSTATTKDRAPAPQVQDNTANNVEALRTQLATEHKRQQQEASLAAASGSNGTLAPQAPAASYGAAGQSVAPVPCVPGQVCDTPRLPTHPAASHRPEGTAVRRRSLPSNSRCNNSRPKNGSASTLLALSPILCLAARHSRSRQRPGREAQLRQALT